MHRSEPGPGTRAIVGAPGSRRARRLFLFLLSSPPLDFQLDQTGVRGLTILIYLLSHTLLRFRFLLKRRDSQRQTRPPLRSSSTPPSFLDLNVDAGPPQALAPLTHRTRPRLPPPHPPAPSTLHPLCPPFRPLSGAHPLLVLHRPSLHPMGRRMVHQNRTKRGLHS